MDSWADLRHLETGIFNVEVQGYFLEFLQAECQQADGSDSTAGVETRKPDRGQMRADNGSAGKGPAVIVPRQEPSGAGSMAPLNGDESAVAHRADTASATGPQGQAIRSSDATAHQTVYDPNNQLGTSMEGKTPATGADVQKVQTPN